jgi:hypothetical protein
MRRPQLKRYLPFQIPIATRQQHGKQIAGPCFKEPAKLAESAMAA